MKQKIIRKIPFLMLFFILTIPIIPDNRGEAIEQLQQKVQTCHQKKLKLLSQCDNSGLLEVVHVLQRQINDCESNLPTNKPSSRQKRREIATLQRMIAEYNRKLLASVPSDKKIELKQLLQEYTQLWQELCLLDQQNCPRQREAFELFFI